MFPTVYSVTIKTSVSHLDPKLQMLHKNSLDSHVSYIFSYILPLFCLCVCFINCLVVVVVVVVVVVHLVK